MRDLPGFYWDEERQRYFALQPEHVARGLQRPDLGSHAPENAHLRGRGGRGRGRGGRHGGGRGGDGAAARGRGKHRRLTKKRDRRAHDDDEDEDARTPRTNNRGGAASPPPSGAPRPRSPPPSARDATRRRELGGRVGGVGSGGGGRDVVSRALRAHARSLTHVGSIGARSHHARCHNAVLPLYAPEKAARSPDSESEPDREHGATDDWNSPRFPVASATQLLVAGHDGMSVFDVRATSGPGACAATTLRPLDPDDWPSLRLFGQQPCDARVRVLSRKWPHDADANSVDVFGFDCINMRHVLAAGQRRDQTGHVTMLWYDITQRDEVRRAISCYTTRRRVGIFDASASMRTGRVAAAHERTSDRASVTTWNSDSTGRNDYDIGSTNATAIASDVDFWSDTSGTDSASGAAETIALGLRNGAFQFIDTREHRVHAGSRKMSSMVTDIAPLSTHPGHFVAASADGGLSRWDVRALSRGPVIAYHAAASASFNPRRRIGMDPGETFVAMDVGRDVRDPQRPWIYGSEAVALWDVRSGAELWRHERVSGEDFDARAEAETFTAVAVEASAARGGRGTPSIRVWAGGLDTLRMYVPEPCVDGVSTLAFGWGAEREEIWL